MKWLIGLTKVIDQVNERIGKSIGWLIVVAILVSTINALIRKIFNLSSNAYLELQWYLFSAAFLMASSWVLKTNDHVRIDLIYGKLSRKARNWIDLFGHIFFLLPFVLVMLYYAYPYMMRSFASGEMSPNSGGLTLWPAKAMITVGFVQLLLQAVSEIIKRAAIIAGIMEDPNPFMTAHDVAEMEAKELAETIQKAQEAAQK